MPARPTSISVHFGALSDPRVERTKAHLLIDILTIGLGDRHYNAPDVRAACDQADRTLVASRDGGYPHTDDGVEVRRVFHKLRSASIENVNGKFKAIFDVQGAVPTKGLTSTRRFALGAVIVYQLTLWHRHEHGLAPSSKRPEEL